MVRVYSTGEIVFDGEKLSLKDKISHTQRLLTVWGYATCLEYFCWSRLFSLMSSLT